MKPDNFFKALRQDETGATAIEYGLIISLLVLVIIAGISSLGGDNAAGWNNIDSEWTAAKAKQS